MLVKKIYTLLLGVRALASSRSYPILIPFLIFRKNFIKKIKKKKKKTPTTDALYLDEGL
jgi:hypothetical protein